jgi:membrane-associated protein
VQLLHAQFFLNMDIIIQFLHNLIDPEWIVSHGGLYIVALIVLVETGLFFGFFLPGDSLLFVAGMIIANTLSPFSVPLMNVLYWIGLITVAGVIGNYAGYWVGRKSDKILFKKDRWLFKRKHLLQAEEFYAKKGGSAIIIARFLPVIRTFAPIVAGIVKMKVGKFSLYNILGSFIWVASIVTAGFLLGENEWAKEHLEKIILGILLITTGPVFLNFLLRKKKNTLAKTVVFPEKKNADPPKMLNSETI